MNRFLKNLVLRALDARGYALVKKDQTTVVPPPPPAEPPPLVRDVAAWSRSPVDLYVGKHYEMFRTGHFDCIYPEWRVRRIRKAVDLYGADWSGKRVVDLGAGLGDIGAFFAELGADVLAVEGRKENVDFANVKYHHLPTFRAVQRDLEADFSDLGRFDLVISFGSLEVIENIDGYIRCCAELSDEIALESFVLDSDDPALTRAWEGPISSDDQTMYGRAVSPSYAYVERAFAGLGFRTERHNCRELESQQHFYGPQGGCATGTRFFWRFARA